MTDRLKEKSRARSRLRWRTSGRRLSYVAAIALVVWVMLWSPVFALNADKVEVTGYGTVVDRDAVQHTLSSFEGTSLLLLNADHVISQLEELQGVREASLERVWPAGMIVTLSPREPVAAIPDGEDSFILVDEEGFDVGTAGAAPEQLPVITVPVGPDNVRVLDAVLDVVSELPVELRERVQGIKAKTEDSVTFALRDGPKVEWGSSEDSALKAEVLQVILESADARNADVIDVSAPTLPITRAHDK
jgi:cell division protein FtsQ